MIDNSKKGGKRAWVKRVLGEQFFTALTTGVSIAIAFWPSLQGALTDDPIHRMLIIFLGLVLGQIIDTNRKMKTSVEKASHLAELTAEEETSAELREPVESMIRAAAQIEQKSVQCFRTQAEKQMEDFAERMEELGRGILVISEHEFHPHVEEVISEAHSSIKATTMFNHRGGFGWWDGKDGRAYWEANKEFLSKHLGARIQRVFIYEEDFGDGKNATMRKIAQEQTKAGVEVSTVSLQDLKESEVAPFDFGVFDNVFAWERSTNGAGEFYQLKFMVNEIEVKKRINHFERIVHVAKPWPDDPQSVDSSLWNVLAKRFQRGKSQRKDMSPSEPRTALTSIP